MKIAARHMVDALDIVKDEVFVMKRLRPVALSRISALAMSIAMIGVLLILPATPGRKETNGAGRCDADGFPLPQGAVARLGSLKFYHPWRINAVALAPDGETIASAADWSPLCFWNRATGRPIRRIATTHEDVKALAYSPDGKHLGLVSHQNGGGGEPEKWIVELRDAGTGKLQHAFPQAGKNKVVAVGFSPRGVLLCAAVEKNHVHVIDVANKQPLYPPLKHRAKVQIVSFARDGKALLTADEDKLFYLRDTVTGKEQSRFHLKEEPVRNGGAAALSPTGNFLAVAISNQCLHLYDAKIKKLLREYLKSRPLALDFSPDGKIMVAANHDVIRLWDTGSGKEINPSTSHEDYPTAAAISPNGKLVATAGQEHSVRLWDAKTGRQLVVFSYLYAPHAITFSPDSKAVLFGGASGKNQICAWRVEDAELVRKFADQKVQVGKLAFSRDGKKLLAQDLYKESIIFEWDAASGKLLKKHNKASPLLWWELTNGKKLRHNGWLAKATFKVQDISPNGRLLATTNGSSQSVDLRDTATGTLLRRTTTEGLDFGRRWDIRKFRFTPDGRTLIMTNYEEGIVNWDANRGRDAYLPIFLFEVASGKEFHRLQGHPHRTEAFDLSTDGRWLVTFGLDRTALVWDLHHLTVSRSKSLTQQDAEALWADLAKLNAVVAYCAIEALTAAPQQTLPVLKKHLHPVRKPDVQEISRWIKDLNSNGFRIRERANSALTKAGEQAEPYLRMALKKPLSLEMHMRVEALIQKLDDEWSKPTPQRVRYLRSLVILERIRSPEARRLLRTLAGGLPGTRTTREASAVLRRLRVSR